MIRRPSKVFLCVAIVMLLVSVLLSRWLSTQFRWLDHTLEPRLVLPDNACFGCAPDNTLFYTSSSGKVNAWDLQTGRLRFQVAGSSPYFMNAMDSGGRRLAIHNEKEFAIFDARSGEHLKAIPVADNRSYHISGTLLCIETDDNHVAVWRLDSGEGIGNIEAHLFQMAVSLDGGRIAAWERQDDKVIIRLWQTMEGSPIALLAEHQMPGQSAAISPDATTIATVGSVAGRTEVALWEIASGKKVDSVLVGEAVGYAHFSVPGGLLFVDSRSTDKPDKRIVFRLSPRLVNLGEFEGHPTLSPDGRLLATALGYHRVVLYEASDMTKIGDLANPSDSSQWVIIGSHGPIPHAYGNFSPDGRWLAVRIPGMPNSGSQANINFQQIQDYRLVRIWDTETCREAHSFTGCSRITFSADNRSMIVSLGDRVEVYDLPLSKPPYRIALCSFVIWLVLMIPVGFACWLLRRRGAGLRFLET